MIGYSTAVHSSPDVDYETDEPQNIGKADLILVVDDSPDNLFLLESLLAEDGYEVACAKDGESALALAESVRPDLILLDIMMPGMDGYEVTRRLRRRFRSSYIPILLVTAHDQPCVVDGLDAGADDFISKPIVEVDELLARVRSLLRLKHTMDERDQIARQREDFVSRLTHDLRTPLIAADRMLTMIHQGTFGEVPSPIEEPVETLIRNNRSLLSMVNTMLEVYRYDAGDKSLTFSRFNICKLLHEAIQELSPRADQKGVALNVSYPALDQAPSEARVSVNSRTADGESASALLGDRQACRIAGDRLELHRVMTNIIGNAIQFTDTGSVDVHLQMMHTLPAAMLPQTNRFGEHPFTAKGQWFVVEVKDTGIGISESDQALIFDRYRQGKNKRAGAGLSLHLAQRIVESHGGTIHVKSELGQGSVFTIVLPTNLL